MILSGATNFLGAGKMSAWFPPEASYHTIGVDDAFFNVYFVAVVAVVLVVGLAIAFVARFNRKGEDEVGAAAGPPNPLLLGAWVLAGVGLVAFGFTADFCGYVDRSVAPLGATQIDVKASQWNWEFTYGNGHVTDTLVVATGEPVQLNMTSTDVVHSLAIPALRINKAILPGQTSTTWFEPGLTDTFSLRSNIFSGPGYGEMRTAMVSMHKGNYDKWLAAAVDIFAGRTPEEVGELLYNRHGCKACHSIDGTKIVGPSLKDVYGNTFPTKEGIMVTVDDAYIKESILNPNASIIEGYEPVMTPYEGILGDQEIEAITAWLKSISQYADASGGN